MVLVKNWLLLNVLFLCNIGKENAFYFLLEQINAFLGYKNKKFIKSNSCHFAKGVNPRFWSKIGHFILGNIGEEMFFTMF